MDELERIKENKLLIYGIGSMAKGILPYVKGLMASGEIIGCAVSKMGESEPVSFRGFEVKEISHYAVSDNNAVVLVATSEQYHAEIKETLLLQGFTHIIMLTNVLRDILVQQYCNSFFQTLGIAMDQEYLKIGAVQLLNPQFLEVGNAVNILNQAADLLLPTIYNEWSLLAEGPYEYGGVQLFAGDVVFDCGANMGVFAAYAASKGGQVFAFEPAEELIPVIDKHSELNGGRITVVESAVSDKTGKVGFIKDSYNCGSNAISKNGSKENLTVKCTTIDDFVKENEIRRVDFIKADIEGAERDMLKGAVKTLQQHAPKLAICTYHLPDDKEVLEKIIIEANPKYKIEHKWEKLYAWVE